MPDGKPAGVKCIHLCEDYSCGIYEQRPKVCIDFQVEVLVCGNDREEAIAILSRLETASDPRG
jgi:Fe-S-cluster containining protein